MKTKVRIYKPAKTAMQSGRGHHTEHWILEGISQSSKTPEHLMGWTSAEDTQDQIRLTFDSLQTAVAFAEERGWTYDSAQTHDRTVRPQSYMNNFEYRTVEYDTKTTGSHSAMKKAKSTSKAKTKKKK